MVLKSDASLGLTPGRERMRKNRSLSPQIRTWLEESDGTNRVRVTRKTKRGKSLARKSIDNGNGDDRGLVV